MVLRLSRKQRRLLDIGREEAEIIIVPGPFQCGKTFSLCFGFTKMVAAFHDTTADFIIGAQRRDLVTGTMFKGIQEACDIFGLFYSCLLYTSPSPRDRQKSRMPSSA